MQLVVLVSSYRQQHHHNHRDLRRAASGAKAEQDGGAAVMLVDGRTRRALPCAARERNKICSQFWDRIGAERERLP